MGITMTGNDNIIRPTEKQHWLVDGLGNVNILVVGAAVLSAAYYVFELRSNQTFLSDRVVSLETDLEAIASRDTDIAQIQWKLESLQSHANGMEVKLEALQDSVRDAESTIRDLQRGTP